MFHNLVSSRLLICLFALSSALAFSTAAQSEKGFKDYTIDRYSKTSPKLQKSLKDIDEELRSEHGISTSQTAVGLLDLKATRLAMIHPDRNEYAGSLPKLGVLLAYFELNPEAATNMDPGTRHDLGLMMKASRNDVSTRFTYEIGLKKIQEVINSYGLYDDYGGLWMGRHFGKSDERIGDPLNNHSHAASVRQLLRFYLMLEQGKLVSPEASRTMREIFESPDIPHTNTRFVKGLEGRNVKIIRKWGTWKTWIHDTAVVTGPDRHYILVALTTHYKGDDYLVDLVQRVDDLMSAVE